MHARDVAGFVRAFAPGGGGAPTHNARLHAAAALADSRYGFAKNARPPKKLDRTLALFDCTSCDKCLPVCPNTAIFRLDVERSGRATHQIGILAEACNDCGNCDVFCPEHGAPNRTKPRFHLSRESYEREAPRDGLWVERSGQGIQARGRFGGREVSAASGEPPGGERERDLLALAEGALAGDNWLSAHAHGTTP